MKKLKPLLVMGLLFIFAQLFADSHPGYPPNPYETDGGRRAPAFSEANAQAIHWLNLSDAYVFDATWLEAGGLLKDVVNKVQWTAAMEAFRMHLGPVHSRVVADHSNTNQLPFGTRGNFVVITYDSSFQRMPSAVETVILMMEGPFNQWKVIGYHIDGR